MPSWIDKPSIENIKVYKQNSVYRVTDVILRKGIRWESDRNTIITDSAYKNTILFDYLTQKKYEYDFFTLKKIVKRHQKKYEVPNPDNLVIHLRLGDVMGDWDDDQNNNYENCKKIYGNLNLPNLPFHDRATIVTALHFGANQLNNKFFFNETAQKRSFEILELLTRRLNSLGISVTYKSSENVDEDLCYMSASKYFMKSSSGFSDMVVHCMNKGTFSCSYLNTDYTYKSTIDTLKTFVKHQIKNIGSTINFKGNSA